MKILFLHGWHSTPGGLKPTYLAELGHEVLNPGLCSDDFEAAMKTAQQAFDEGQPDVVVGSSRGGAVAMNLEIGETPLVLMCPAWRHWGTAKTVGSKSIILHSSKDEVVDFDGSVELRAASGLPLSALRDVGFEHRMACQESLAALATACRELVFP
jgi:hypothetical protein